MQYSPISLLRKSVRARMVPSKRIRDLSANRSERRKLVLHQFGQATYALAGLAKGWAFLLTFLSQG
jgi:hypothetical protein